MLRSIILVFVICSQGVSTTVLASDKAIGKLIFTIGKVTIQDDMGKSKRVHRGSEIFKGDILKTSTRAQAQIKFVDGAKVSIRPGSEFIVNAYIFDKNNPQRQKSEFTLNKGGIRSITGTIGRTNKKAFKLSTMVATIGIRGTDFSVMLCDGDCESRYSSKAPNGLYVGVIEGGLFLENSTGITLLEANQFAVIDLLSKKAKRIPKPPLFLMFDKTKASRTDIKAQRQRISRAIKSTSKTKQTTTIKPKDFSQNTQNDSINLSTEIINTQIDFSGAESLQSEFVASNITESTEVNISLEQSTTTTNTSNTLPSPQGTRFVTVNPNTLVTVDQTIKYTDANVVNNYTLIGLDAHDASLDTTGKFTTISTFESSVADLGYDAATGISWGRWANPSIDIKVTTVDGESTSSTSLINESLHWILGPDDSSTIQLPATGIKNYQLLGATNPTDNHGNVGTLGNATLSTDFEALNVDANIELLINNQTWQGSQQNIPINSNTAQFQSNQLNVQIDGTSDASMNGSIQGGLIGNANADPTNAAIGYTLDGSPNNIDTSVSGAAVLQAID